MNVAVLPGVADADRLAALQRVCLLDSESEESFDRLTRFATRLLDVPIALVSLVDADRQFFKSSIGLPEPWASRRQTPLSHSFCQYAVESGEPLVLEDAREHPLLYNNPAIGDLGVIAYAGVPLRDSAGFVLGTFCVIDNRPRDWPDGALETLRDLAQSVVTEMELRAVAVVNSRLCKELEGEEQRLRRLLARLRDAVLAVDADLRVRFVNESARTIEGLEQLAVGDVLPEPWPGFSLRRFAEELHSAGAAERHATVTLPQARSRSLVGLPADGSKEAILVMSDDSLRQRREAAEREFVTNAAHELQTPLTAILTAVEVLQSGAKNVEGDRDVFLADIERETARLKRLVRALLLLAELETRVGPPLLEEIELAPLLDEVAAGVPVRAGVTVESACPAALKLTTNSELLEQVLVSLAGNAVKYTRTCMRIEATAEEDYVAIAIVDDGPGVAPQEQHRIFERFYRSSRKGDGFGLGLAIARQAIEALGGTLELDSYPGAGARARVVVPVGERP
jgi:signal transduction histidine kinase